MKNCQPMKVHLQVRIESHPFSTGDLIGGDAALDFINTVTGRDQSPRDWLDSYMRLLEWAALVRLLPENILRALARRARPRLKAPAARLKGERVFLKPWFALLKGTVPGAARRKALA